jgi:hypothetical protein
VFSYNRDFWQSRGNLPDPRASFMSETGAADGSAAIAKAKAIQKAKAQAKAEAGKEVH